MPAPTRSRSRRASTGSEMPSESRQPVKRRVHRRNASRRMSRVQRSPSTPIARPIEEARSSPPDGVEATCGGGMVTSDYNDGRGRPELQMQLQQRAGATGAADQASAGERGAGPRAHQPGLVLGGQQPAP